MNDRLIALARRIERAPWNRAGSDKTWVLDALWQRVRFEHEIRTPRPSVPHGAGAGR